MKSTFLLQQGATLTPLQAQLEEQLLDFIQKQLPTNQTSFFVIEGDAGSGKSVVLNEVFTNVQQLSRSQGTFLSGSDNYLLVNHNEMLKVYKEGVTKQNKLLKKDFQKPTPFINKLQKEHRQADLVFVDEGHLLLTKSDAYNNFHAQNQLVELAKVAKIIVLVFDPHQVIKLKSYWSSADLQRLLQPYPHKIFHLDQQERINDPAISQWINAFTSGKLLPLPASRTFDLQVFADGRPLYQAIKTKDHSEGLARMIATTDYPFTVMDDKVWYVTAGNLKLPWDQINFTDRPWAERPETINEVGSIYTIQGFDLNYAGVILGPGVKYDRATRKVYVDAQLYQDHEAYKKRDDLSPEKSAQAKAAIFMNSVNILMKRGRLGLYLYAADPDLRQALLELSAK